MMRVWSSISTLRDLQPGDMIRHATNGDRTYIVTANYGTRVTAVRTADLTQASEWQVFRAVAATQPAEAK